MPAGGRGIEQAVMASRHSPERAGAAGVENNRERAGDWIAIDPGDDRKSGGTACRRLSHGQHRVGRGNKSKAISCHG